MSLSQTDSTCQLGSKTEDYSDMSKECYLRCKKDTRQAYLWERLTFVKEATGLSTMRDYLPRPAFGSEF